MTDTGARPSGRRRVARQQDYIALVRGKVKVRLRKDVAAALGISEDEEIELDSQQGVGAGTEGFTSVALLTARPQLDGTSSERKPVAEQSTSSSENASDWDTDSASSDLDAETDQFDPATDGDLVALEVEDSLAEDLAVEIADDIEADVAADIVDNDSIIDDVTEVAAEAPMLGSFPGPPAVP